MGGRFQPGDFAFPFAFRLPAFNLPSSYHDSQSYVRYWLDATIERPMWFNQKAATAIFVMESVDVSTPELQVHIWFYSIISHDRNRLSVRRNMTAVIATLSLGRSSEIQVA